MNNSVGGIDVTEPIKIEGQNYKIGLHGKVFAQRDDEWVLSTNFTPEDIHRAHEKTLTRKYRRPS